jgi:hypothetical protein
LVMIGWKCSDWCGVVVLGSMRCECEREQDVFVVKRCVDAREEKNKCSTLRYFITPDTNVSFALEVHIILMFLYGRATPRARAS